MNIIYITPLWSGMKPFFLEGKENASGMPAFYEVFHRIINRPDINKVYVILFSDSSNFSLPTKYRNKIVLIPYNVKLNNFKIIKYLFALLKTIIICKQEQITLIYGHGPVSFLAGLASFFCTTKAFHRVYGTFFINEIESSKIKLFLKYPFAYLSYSVKSDGLIITNDGTHADTVYKKIGNQKTPLHFFLNGIDKNPEIAEVEALNIPLNQHYVVYIARLDRWKRQHIFIEILSEAKTRGFAIPGYIIGQPYDTEYYHELKHLISEKKLESLITIIPGLPRNQVNAILKKAICSFSLYNTSNLGNVFLESLSLGIPVIAFNINNSLDCIDKNCYIAIENENINEAVEKLISLWSSPQLCQELSQRALNYSEKILSWSERSIIEINLLLNG